MARAVSLLLVAVICHGQEPGLDPELTPVLPPGLWKQVEITAYCGGPCRICDTIGRTADGTLTRKRPYGAAAENSISLGGQVYIPPGIGYLDRSLPFERLFKLDDRGGALDSERQDKDEHPFVRLDLRFVDHSSARRFGRKIAWVYFCEKLKK